MTNEEKIETILKRTTLEMNRVLEVWRENGFKKDSDDFKSLFKSYFCKYFKEQYDWRYFNNHIKRFDYLPIISKEHSCLLGITHCTYYNDTTNFIVDILNNTIKSFNFLDLKYQKQTNTITNPISTFGVDYNKLINIKF